MYYVIQVIDHGGQSWLFGVTQNLNKAERCRDELKQNPDYIYIHIVPTISIEEQGLEEAKKTLGF